MNYTLEFLKKEIKDCVECKTGLCEYHKQKTEELKRSK